MKIEYTTECPIEDCHRGVCTTNCEYCRGTGMGLGWSEKSSCSHCKGNGYFRGECETCNGTGQVNISQYLTYRFENENKEIEAELKEFFNTEDIFLDVDLVLINNKTITKDKIIEFIEWIRNPKRSKENV